MPDPTSQPSTPSGARTPHAEPPGSRAPVPVRPGTAQRPGPATRPPDATRPAGAGATAASGEGPTAEERERGRLVGLAVIGAAALIAVVVTIGIFIPAIGAVLSNAPTPVDVSQLPGTVTVCSRAYVLAGEPLTLAAVRAADGRDPVVVGATNAGCPSQVCVTDGRCLSVIYVKTTEDTYAPYRVADDGA